MICPMCGNILENDQLKCNSCGWQGENSSEHFEMNFTKPLRKKSSGVVTFGGFVLTVILTVIFSWICLNTVVLKITSRENIKELFTKSEITSELIWSMEVGDDNETVGDVIVNELAKEVGEDDAKEIIDLLEVDEFVNELFADVISSIASSDGMSEINVDILIDNLEEHKAEIEEITGEKIDDDTIKEFKKSCNELSESVNSGIENFNREYQENNSLYVILGGSKITLYAFWTIAVVLTSLLILMYFKNQSGVYRATRCVAIASGNASVTLLGFTKLFKIALQEVAENGNSTDEIIWNFMDGILSMINSAIYPVAFIFVVSVIASVVLYVYYLKHTAKF